MAKRSRRFAQKRGKTAVPPHQAERERRLFRGNLLISIMFTIYVFWRAQPEYGLFMGLVMGLGLGVLTWLLLYGVAWLTRWRMRA